MKIGFYTYSWNFNETDAQTIAKYFDMSQSWWVGTPPSSNDYSAKAAQVHALKSNYKFLLYRNVNCIYNYWTDEWNYAQAQGWLLKDASGNYVRDTTWPENYFVDVTNRAYQLWLAQKIKSWLDQYPFFDGVMADCSMFQSVSAWAGGQSPINPRTGVPFTSTQVVVASADMLNAIIDAIGTNKILMPNGLWSGFVFADPVEGANYRSIISAVPRLTSLMSEGCWHSGVGGSGKTWPSPYGWWTEAQWVQSVEMVRWIQTNFLAGHPERTFEQNGSAEPQSVPGDATNMQVAMYDFCSIVLSSDYFDGRNLACLGNLSSLLPSWATLGPLLLKLQNVDLGNPVGAYYKISGASVYARDFTAGKVLVNPSYNSYSVVVGSGYKDLNNNAVPSTLTVQPHTGMLLFAEVTPPVVQAGFPIWVIPATLIGLGAIYIVAKKK
jgi:hypothetical protein